MFLLISSPLYGATYYVCSNGNGAGGTDGSDWDNCMDGFDDIGTPGAGDTLYLRDDDGDYEETLTVPSSGSADNPITYAAATGESPVINSNNIRANGILIDGKDYITIDGIHATKATSSNLLIDNDSDNNIIKNCIFSYSENFGMRADHFNIDNLLVQSNEAYENMGYGGFLLSSGTSLIVEYNSSHDNGDGVGDHGYYFQTSSGTIIRYNTAYNNFYNGFKFGTLSDGGDVIYNLSWGNGVAGYSFDGRPGGTSNIDNMYNNVDYNSARGMWINCDNGDGFEITNVKNNIFSGETYGLYIFDDTGTGTVTITNWTNNDVFADTDYINFPGGDPTGSNGNISVDPLLTNPANADFTLTSASPAIGAGVDVSLTLDYEGNLINNPPSIGAYAYDPLNNIRGVSF